MKTVWTKEELKKAIESGETEIYVEGDYAKKIVKRAKVRKGSLWAGIGLTAIGIALIPFSGGASAAAVIQGLEVTIGGTSVVATAGELAMVLGSVTFISSVAMFKNYTIEINDGTVKVYRKKP